MVLRAPLQWSVCAACTQRWLAVWRFVEPGKPGVEPAQQTSVIRRSLAMCPTGESCALCNRGIGRTGQCATHTHLLGISSGLVLGALRRCLRLAGRCRRRRRMCAFLQGEDHAGNSLNTLRCCELMDVCAEAPPKSRGIQGLHVLVQLPRLKCCNPECGWQPAGLLSSLLLGLCAAMHCQAIQLSLGCGIAPVWEPVRPVGTGHVADGLGVAPS